MFFQHLELEFWFVLLKTDLSKQRHTFPNCKSALLPLSERSVTGCSEPRTADWSNTGFQTQNQFVWALWLMKKDCVCVSVCLFFFWRESDGEDAQAWIKAHEHGCTHTHSLRCWFNGNSLCVCTNCLSGTVRISTLMKYWLEILKYHPALIKNSMRCLIYTTVTNHNEFL